jgi:transcriptional regulator with XRE-family HTH domain
MGYARLRRRQLSRTKRKQLLVDTQRTPTRGEAGRFGVLLHRHRMAAGISQKELAERAGLSTRAISDLERGARRFPYPTTVRRLARALSLRGTERSALLAARETAGVSTYAANAITPIASPAHSASGRDAGVGIEGTAARRPSTLPVQLSSFVGRGRETAAIMRLLLSTRLLTITGAGGSGKTRLAVHVAHELSGDYPAGVWFVDLAPLGQPELLAQTVALAVGVGEEPGCPIEAAILRAIADRRLLVIVARPPAFVPAAGESSTNRAAATDGRQRGTKESGDVRPVGKPMTEKVATAMSIQSWVAMSQRRMQFRVSAGAMGDSAQLSSDQPRRNFARTLRGLAVSVAFLAPIYGIAIASTVIVTRLGTLSSVEISNETGT